MKEQTCCFTGHRRIPPEQYEHITERLKSEITALINLFLEHGVANYEIVE